jgi:hypothetical protein
MSFTNEHEEEIIFAGDFEHELFVTGNEEDIVYFQKNLKFVRNTRSIKIDKYIGKVIYRFLTGENELSEWIEDIGKKYDKLRFCLNSHQSMNDIYLKVIYDHGKEILSLDKSRDFYFYHFYDGHKICDKLLDYCSDKPEIRNQILNMEDNITDLLDEEDIDLLEDLIDCTENLNETFIKKYNLMRKYWKKWIQYKNK